MKIPRSAGILMHPTSFPGPYGIGDLGREATRFLDFLVEAGQSFWQILPLNPTGYGDSPYASFSAFAGNPLLVDLQGMAVEQGFPLEQETVPLFPREKVDFGAVIPWKMGILAQAARHFRKSASPQLREDYAQFCVENASWLEDYALFRALKEAHGGTPWNEWEHELVTRQPLALETWRQRLADSVFAHKYYQYQFYHQWDTLREAAHKRGLSILGDIPIFVAFDSADAWAHPELFELDERLQPTAVAGVPPDYFSPTGQLWGNPLYQWEKMAEDGYAWWVARIRQTLRTVDWIRLDHFRGFEGYWAVPASNLTAEHGQWRKGPGASFFRLLQEQLGSLPFVAEDLGFITLPVEELRKQFGLPGMKVLQFAFNTDAGNVFLPHNYEPDAVVYTGTHDNQTTRGYFEQASPEEWSHLLRYLGKALGADRRVAVWEVVRLAYQSVATLAVVPLQDALELGDEARMNHPGRSGHNWRWRLSTGRIDAGLANRLRNMAEVYGRLPLVESPPRSVWM